MQQLLTKTMFFFSARLFLLSSFLKSKMSKTLSFRGGDWFSGGRLFWSDLGGRARRRLLPGMLLGALLLHIELVFVAWAEKSRYVHTYV